MYALRSGSVPAAIEPIGFISALLTLIAEHPIRQELCLANHSSITAGGRCQKTGALDIDIRSCYNAFLYPRE